jgi:drug/metabolite transporter (DMT)-like permease
MPPTDDRARRQALLALGAALITVTLWASAFVGIRSAGRDLSPGALTLCRLLIGSVVLGALVLARREPLPARRDLPAIVLCGLLWFGVYNVALNAAERRVDAGWGALLCVGAALAYAGGVVAQKPALARSSALQVTWLACSVGALACLPFGPTLVHELGDAHRSAVAWAVYLGVLPTAVAFTTWAYALAQTTAGRMGSTTYLVPPLAIVLGWAILGEVPPALALAGGALCLVGVAVARGQIPRLSRRAPAAAPAA